MGWSARIGGGNLRPPGRRLNLRHSAYASDGSPPALRRRSLAESPKSRARRRIPGPRLASAPSSDAPGPAAVRAEWRRRGSRASRSPDTEPRHEAALQGNGFGSQQTNLYREGPNHQKEERHEPERFGRE